MDVVWFLLIGLAAGWLAGVFVSGRGFGLVGNLFVGVIGALAGGFLFRLAGLMPYTLLGSLITATVGAVIFLSILPMVLRRRRG